jgi:hypothetical protein
MASVTNDGALAENIEEYIHGYLATRLICKGNEGNEVKMREVRPDMYQPFFEVALDMFEAGAAWADVTSGRDRLSIIQVTR